MKSFLLVLFVVVIGLVGVGFYRGWFSTETSTSSHKSNVKLSVDQDKIKEDIDSLKKSAGSLTEKKDPAVPVLPPKI